MLSKIPGRSSALFVVFVFLPAAVLGQGKAHSPDLELGVGLWALDSGTASAGPTQLTLLSLGAGWRTSDYRSVQLRVTVAPEGDVNPGVIALQAAFRLETRREQQPLGIFGSIGFGVNFWRADNNERIRETCRDLCLFEGVGYSTGAEPAFGFQLGTRLAFCCAIAVEPYAEGLLSLGVDNSDSKRSLRFGISVARRPRGSFAGLFMKRLIGSR